ncbi:toxin-antitoxin system YwqK family antitoxin [Helicobacter bilis]|uniref:toxin-antitoxin system YwqK family antitoxin n=1 Tax=Helicobacter bilis TaxID=37372 RepID=UPI002557FBA6|nr:toxin-antitoxin system YwqK family antitoxin [Helicobacter bilis]
MLLKCVFMGLFSLSILHADILKECKSETDFISGCVVKEYDENGKLEGEAPYKNGEIEGIEKWYYKNGNLRAETPYKNGKIEGIEKSYDESGKLWMEIPYKNGRFDGILKRYYENGKLMAEIPHLNDLFHGDMKYYTEDGKLLALFKVENNDFISGKCFNDKVLTDKDLKEMPRDDTATEAINYLKEICLKESDSK